MRKPLKVSLASFQLTVPLLLLLLLPFSATLCQAKAVVTCSQPTISSVTPTPWVAGQTYNNVVITGTGLLGPDSASLCNTISYYVSLSNGGTATLSIVSKSDTQITASVTLPASNTAQTACVAADNWQAVVVRKLAVASPLTCPEASNGFGTFVPFAVPVYPGVTVTSVVPDGWWASKKQDITIYGVGFLTASDPGGPSQVTVTDGAHAVTLSNVTVASSTQITASVDVSKNAPNAPAETATLTVTNPSTGGTPQSSTANPAPVVLPVPVIKWKNKSVSGDHPQIKNPKVIVGQPVELTTLPASLPGSYTISKSAWGVPGTSIKQYHEDDDDGISVDETDLDTQNTTFYWLYPQTPLDVTYEYCATDPNGNQVCTSPQAKATFKATGPTASLSTWDSKEAKIEQLYICDNNGNATNDTAPWLGYGDLYYPQGTCSGAFHGTPGIKLTASGASSGKYVFVQIVNADFGVYTEPMPKGGGPAQPPDICGPHAGLDKQYPFPGVYRDQPWIAYDGPQLPLDFDLEAATATRNFFATMYLLWQPDQLAGTTTESIPVPIGFQDWNFIATATQAPPIGNDNWSTPRAPTKSGDEGEGFVPAGPSDNSIYGYPQWSYIVSTRCGVSQTISTDALDKYSLRKYLPGADNGSSKEEQ